MRKKEECEEGKGFRVGRANDGEKGEGLRVGEGLRLGRRRDRFNGGKRGKG